MGLAFLRRRRNVFSSDFSGLTKLARGKPAAPAWAWRSSSTSSTLTTAKSGWKASPGKELRFISLSPWQRGWLEVSEGLEFATRHGFPLSGKTDVVAWRCGQFAGFNEAPIGQRPESLTMAAPSPANVLSTPDEPTGLARR